MPSDNTKNSWCLLALASVAIVELVAVMSFRFLGLQGTAGTILWVASGLFIASPILVTAFLFVFRRGRINISFLLFTTAMAAVFVSLLLPVYLRESSSRNLVDHLRALGATASTKSRLDEYYKRNGIQANVATFQGSQKTSWIVPLVGGPTRDRAEDLQAIQLTNDKQVSAVLEMSGRLSRLREVSIDGSAVGASALSSLARNVPELESLDLYGAVPPTDFLCHFKRVQHLTILVDNPSTELTLAEARNIAAIQGLETLCIGYCKIAPETVIVISESPGLHRLYLTRTSIQPGTVLHVRPTLDVRIQQ